MAKRRKLIAPSAEDLSRIEEEFRRETTVDSSGIFGSAPIAQVVAETASELDPRSAADRERSARDRNEAEAFRDLTDRGLVMAEIPLAEIDADSLVRDRVILDPEEMQELQMSIAANGLRLPIEVYPLDSATGGPKYGLLSGYRRFRAMQTLYELTGRPEHSRIRAVRRDAATIGGSFAAMVEENEVRANLSHFERGRIAVIASQQGAFGSVEAAVEALFPVASKGKRSKIRSFALIFEELGDMLKYPEQLKERDGLKVASALRVGGESKLRAALEHGQPQSAAQEAESMLRVIDGLDLADKTGARGGRPKKPGEAKPQTVRETRQLPNGISLQSQPDKDGWSILISGQGVNEDAIDDIMEELSALLTKG
ncbi:chromosome partitioning protein ParB [Thioclava sp. SK-1]|uniref:ParB/RepB/Spo0J family partition protein n=1 Tax=Thioclava sp. SK-1 TaxID=1889770 RepID=UPI0008257C9D|nr:ParB N-terminal domain-containing protein [Thioclava sp. SK-1]OCX66265.1 chromosome partitioning protein ParB [Thioclava sp. SK-1]